MEKEELLGENKITLKLESYNDIFSSFDANPYLKKALSIDFLDECKRASRDKKVIYGDKGPELRLIVQRAKRNATDEANIKKRLKEHFQRHYLEKLREIKKTKLEGFTWFGVGVVLMFFAVFIQQLEGFFYQLLFIMSEPASWFMFWEGLDKVFITAKQKTSEYEFYHKMNHSQINFFSS